MLLEIPPTRRSLIESLLDEQQTLTAVEAFSQQHEGAEYLAQAKYYRDLIPTNVPGAGEQYAFEVDLDSCSGCKSCVAACHNLNGLEEDELWRNVGLLHGGTSNLSVLQHVTTACHHCVEPACLDGCPVNAYEKDDATGIVRHLDDQCIGCQYCMLKCPYDVPRYSKSKGIVRKCDMCQDRLAAGEAPACVQSCPTQAIRIRLVDKQVVLEETEANHFLPGAPEPGYTVPTTVYKTNRPLPRNLLPADYYTTRPQHGHLPLVVMLVLTQMSVGAFVVEQVLFHSSPWIDGAVQAAMRPVHLVAALLLGVIGLSAAVFHLGRPWYAFRAILGLRRSWLSREILAFALFAACATAYVLVACAKYVGLPSYPTLEQWLGAIGSTTGVMGVYCSVMIYVDTRRAYWNAPMTSAKFFLTMLVLGLPTALLVSLIPAAWSDQISVANVMSAFGNWMCRALVVASVAKLLFEATVFVNLRRKQHTPLKRTALLLTGELGMVTLQRFFFGIVGGIVLPLVLVNQTTLAGHSGFHPLFIGLAVAWLIVMLLVGELLERYLFFRAVVSPKMPGAPAT